MLLFVTLDVSSDESRFCALRSMLKNTGGACVMNKAALTDQAFIHIDLAPSALPVREFGFGG